MKELDSRGNELINDIYTSARLILVRLRRAKSRDDASQWEFQHCNALETLMPNSPLPRRQRRPIRPQAPTLTLGRLLQLSKRPAYFFLCAVPRIDPSHAFTDKVLIQRPAPRHDDDGHSPPIVIRVHRLNGHLLPVRRIQCCLFGARAKGLPVFRAVDAIEADFDLPLV